MQLRSLIRHLAFTQTRKLITDPSIVRRDILYLSVKGGRGGNGLQKYNGIGGNGASIYVRPIPEMRFLPLCNQFSNKRLVKGKPGTDSSQIKLMGKNADPIIINVPMGVECVNATTRMLLARCVQPGMQYLIAKGGAGGSQVNQYKGQKSREIRLAIHFKLTTNVGFVGMPNAGKSTLLKAMVPDKFVKIADYPFTTLKPQVLDVKFDEEPTISGDKVTDLYNDPDDIFSLSVADLPGIIEGASKNRGRGYAFLKHLEYSEIIIMVVDVEGFKLSDHFDEPFRDAFESIAVLNKEMEAYDKLIIKKPIILVLNKIDLEGGKEKAKKVTQLLADPNWHLRLPETIRPVTPIHFNFICSLSARSGSIKELKTKLRQLYNKNHSLEPLKLDEDWLDETERSGKYVL